jgi:low molecular weight protein-tyrosine phosphatase
VRILFVCTGNLCRSPLAERLAVTWAQELLADSPEAADVEILSAGLQATAGRPMDPSAAEALTRHGGDASAFRSREYTPDLADAADLVFTMTRYQRRAVLETTPRGLRKTFTLSEAADLLSQVDRSGLLTLPLSARARELGLRLDTARGRRRSTDLDDIADPYGRRQFVHRQVAETIAGALRPLADVLFTSVRTRLAAPVPV